MERWLALPFARANDDGHNAQTMRKAALQEAWQFLILNETRSDEVLTHKQYRQVTIIQRVLDCLIPLVAFFNATVLPGINDALSLQTCQHRDQFVFELFVLVRIADKNLER